MTERKICQDLVNLRLVDNHEKAQVGILPCQAFWNQHQYNQTLHNNLQIGGLRHEDFHERMQRRKSVQTPGAS